VANHPDIGAFLIGHTTPPSSPQLAANVAMMDVEVALSTMLLGAGDLSMEKLQIGSRLMSQSMDR
jgi:hypothetical protein